MNMTSIKIVSYRRGRKTQNTRQAIARISEVNTKEAASKFVGKRVELPFPKNPIKGVITGTHGGKGRVIIRFRRGIPGQAITKEVKF